VLRRRTKGLSLFRGRKEEGRDEFWAAMPDGARGVASLGEFWGQLKCLKKTQDSVCMVVCRPSHIGGLYTYDIETRRETRHAKLIQLICFPIYKGIYLYPVYILGPLGPSRDFYDFCF
jgi:hypothetical protein